MRDIITLACTECKRRNYSTTKNKKKTTERLELSKFCRFCRKHTAHKRARSSERAVASEPSRTEPGIDGPPRVSASEIRERSPPDREGQ